MKTVVLAGLLLLGVPATSALAHDDDHIGGGYRGLGFYESLFRQRLRDELEHLWFRREFADRREVAHERGFNGADGAARRDFLDGRPRPGFGRRDERGFGGPEGRGAPHRASEAMPRDVERDHPGAGFGRWGGWRLGMRAD